LLQPDMSPVIYPLIYLSDHRS